MLKERMQATAPHYLPPSCSFRLYFLRTTKTVFFENQLRYNRESSLLNQLLQDFLSQLIQIF